MNGEVLNEPKKMTVLESYINTTDYNLDGLIAIGNRLAKVVYKISELPLQSEKTPCEESDNIIGQLWNQSGKLNNIITDLDSLVKILENII